MFLKFFTELRDAKVPVTLKEYLALMDAMDKGVIDMEVEQFYYLSRTALVKDERNIDKFDKVFGETFKGIESMGDAVDVQDLPEEWLRKLSEKFLTPEEMEKIESLGGWEKLMDTLKERLEEQKKRHEGGNKWIGTGGTSPFGANGYNPEGVRIGQNKSRHRKAVKVWDKREYKNLDDSVEIGTRNIKIAMRRLRKWARTGAPDELDLDNTIRATAKQGYLDLVMRPERRNSVNLLLFLDVGGSMDPHIRVCEELFSAARSEFKNLEYYYFHNCIYEGLWKDNRRRHNNKIPTWDVLHKFSSDYKVMIVGDATMSPYEITYPGGSVEHWNEEAGGVWLQRLVQQFPDLVWLNPSPEGSWQYTASVKLIGELIGQHRMFQMTLAGLEDAMKELSR
ncbi:VWA domain-containing protein [Ponticaulis sp.]|uniref:vWA domain-containing protein n=1 Tax=Ponticaulis sp. TaxID=2020902 RepID=UPI000B7067DE|nr:VWA domain-containing protein [Ponticaulis sp.]MAJ08907.1 VWA domain-containing protein [Ponticaulis sp.]MDF1681837.1 VWA domain-containing protein [Ponticaulis sp.]RPG16705.1 MAG: VWA domain-containing protein [Hyphomonadaceae bacterium TMED125]HBJ91722.1 VWA domain-containing protein [Hyphomonadaceae bacterium]|tara:strand:- start:20267 stop:21448 length:1182 start_codon:yes stop_codon:yes gene_type:complete